MSQYTNELYARNYALECENKALRGTIDEFKSGQRYKKLEAAYKKIVAGYKRENKRLSRELEEARKTTTRVRDTWFEQCDSDWEKYRSELEKKNKRILELEEQHWAAIQEYEARIQAMETRHMAEMKKEEEEAAKKDAIIQEIKARLAHAEALLDRDGTNTGTPTSQTSPGKQKRIPNSRKNTGKQKGGQKGHEQHVLEAPKEEEVDETIYYSLNEEDKCPGCESKDMVYSGEYEDHYEYDVKIKVIRKRHRYYLYQCLICGTIVKSADGPDFRSQCHYGPNVQAIALSLMNTVNAPMNKSGLFLGGITNEGIHPSDGYIAKLQARAAKGLEQFHDDLRLKLITEHIVYWDDTVSFINTKRTCFRFYGNELIALYTAHMQKGLQGLMEDNVLPLLTSKTKVMHDHNTVNYNPAFHFENLECNQHYERDLQKNSDDTNHKWSVDLKDHISSTINDRKKLIEAGKKEFDRKYIASFHLRVDELLRLGWQEYAADKERLKKYGAKFERALLIRTDKYRKNYFAWIDDFSLPTTSNLAERALRPIKSKLKISGQFESIDYARYYAMIRSYIETCRRHNRNENEALSRLCEGRPYTVAELFS